MQPPHMLLRARLPRYGDNDPNLWVEALGYFADHPEPCEEEIGKVCVVVASDAFP